MRLTYGTALFFVAAAACGDNIRPNTPPGGDGGTADAPIDTPVMCQPNEVLCDGDDLVTCDANGMEGTREDCAVGCNSGTTPPRCNIPVISNVNPNTCETAGVATLEVAAGATVAIGTADAGCDEVITQGANLPKICVKKYATVNIAATGTVNVTGPNALAIVSTGAMVIDGTIDASAGAMAPGPGGNVGMNGAGGTPTAVSAGGGGAGGLTAGGEGAVSAVVVGGNGGMAGVMFGTPEIVPNRGGMRGGNGGPQPQRQAAGGHGGGALQLGSCLSISIGAEAVIDVGGGGGQGGNGSLQATLDPGGGGGGGGGGSVLVEAPSLTVAGGVYANGGGGGSGGAHGTNNTPGVDGNPGQDGQRSTMPAAGGEGVVINPIVTGPGGNGGALDTAPMPGGQPTGAQLVESSGGGGGAAGYIRFNSADGMPVTTGAEVSPAPTSGEMARN